MDALEISAKPNGRVSPKPKLSNDMVPGVKNSTDLYSIKAILCIPLERFFLNQHAWMEKRKNSLYKMTYR